MELGLSGRTAIVCGASSGIGLAIAESLAAEGANVAMFARRREILAREAERIGALAVRGDVTNPADLKRLVERTLEAFGGIDILVNNSGGPPRTPAVGLTDDQVEGAVELLLLSAIRLTALCLPQLERSGRGRVVNIESSSVREPIENLALSNARSPGCRRLGEDAGPRARPEEDHRQHDRAGPDRDGAARGGLRGQAAGRRHGEDPAAPLRPAARGRGRRLLPRLRRRELRHRRGDAGRRWTDAQPPLSRISST